MRRSERLPELVAWIDEHDRQRIADRADGPPRRAVEYGVAWLGQCRTCGEFGIGPCPCHAREVVRRMANG